SRLYLLANVLPHYATPFPTLRFSFLKYGQHLSPHSFPTRRSSDLIEGLRLFARTLAIQERFLPDPREKEMGGEIGQVRLDARGVETLEDFGNRAVQRLAFARQELCIDGLPRQGVPEGKLLRRLLDDELGRDQLLEEPQELRFVVLGECL